MSYLSYRNCPLTGSFVRSLTKALSESCESLPDFLTRGSLVRDIMNSHLHREPFDSRLPDTWKQKSGRSGFLTGNRSLQDQYLLRILFFASLEKISRNSFDSLNENTEKPDHKGQVFLYLSGSRESNPDHTVPNRVHYHYATPRCSERHGVAMLFTTVTSKQSLLGFEVTVVKRASRACVTPCRSEEGLYALHTPSSLDYEGLYQRYTPYFSEGGHIEDTPDFTQKRSIHFNFVTRYYHSRGKNAR
jgi:hypothetical protein